MVPSLSLIQPAVESISEVSYVEVGQIQKVLQERVGDQYIDLKTRIAPVPQDPTTACCE